ncbi:peptide-methionine (S)-S-oxide reductase MsrA [Acinetobacter courvalinii]|jgi:peptide-methionine (S)-S-oxide reductase|uniref:Peptide methionine sulfoxide reductase MsrA n=1 Tax=Acinetobacter courvalinii TaxID=280147 RepID=N9NYF2_9GAMM|nr:MULTISPECIES: peptide-methionine (S)-S-oxide reductase MsrA [Acinetobacter]EXB24622.1 peptide-methionine (S)-S-oxide reductase [Acinetobacter baumannii 1437282]EXB45973.1 peptide-methionine (S)-S-oxide reductase [Acinetobacter baumannii 146457]RSN80818.1 peptide-methionine (S)-S-oxide reductase [Acinetobacter baumannii]EKU53020.1 peptide-methionine (S)-S-oxide reductase [Acinetobacter sp. WC-323]ENX10576.1 peptide methionine sulfoxide reductase msrA [Acinetobacter courvalinii]
MQQAMLGGGCFWCVEAVFLQLKGVEKVVSGYAGGITQNPSYEQVCQGNTQHAEVILIDFDEQQISYTQLLNVFFTTHDPTTLNRQGNDIGTQYRSVIYYFDNEQKQQAEQVIQSLEDEGLNIVTELSPVPTFYPAEEYHQNFFARNPSQGYCNFSIPPKLSKLRAKYLDLLKDE